MSSFLQNIELGEGDLDGVDTQPMIGRVWRGTPFVVDCVEIPGRFRDLIDNHTLR